MATSPLAESNAHNSFERDLPIVVANTPFTPAERRIALGVIVLVSVVAAAIVPVATVQLGRFNAFVPALQTTLCAAELITALLLFGQYVLWPRYGLLALASGYIASGLFAFLHSLTFPGAYAPTGLFGGPDTGAWLYCLWHIGFPLSVIAYWIFGELDRGGRDRSPYKTVGLVVVSTLAAIAAIAWAVSASKSLLPALYEADLRTQTPFTSYLTGAILLLTVIAFALIAIRARTILDLWLMVALFTAVPDLLIPTVLPAPRFSVAWYVARGYALITSLAVLSLLLVETMRLYQRLAASFILARRETANRMMSLDVATSAIIHELRQPLTTIAASGDAGLSWLAQKPPNVREARKDFHTVVETTHRANDVLSGVRNLFRDTARQTLVSIEDVVEQVLQLVRHDLQSSGVLVQRSYGSVQYRIAADHTQLQQVVLNLVKNAIDAMDGQKGSARRLQILTAHRKNWVILCINDAGPGVPDEARERIFDPFFTTKPGGMGLGLSICRQIVVAHGGSLVLAGTGDRGSSFRIELPVVDVVPE